MATCIHLEDMSFESIGMMNLHTSCSVEGLLPSVGLLLLFSDVFGAGWDASGLVKSGRLEQLHTTELPASSSSNGGSTLQRRGDTKPLTHGFRLG